MKNPYINEDVLNSIHPTAAPADESISPASIVSDLIVIALNGNVLLRVSDDGTIEGDMENMGIAAAVFMKELRNQIDIPARNKQRIEELLAKNTELTLKLHELSQA